MNQEAANESGEKTDLNRYKQAADVAYQYAKRRADQRFSPSEETNTETQDQKEAVL